MINQQTLVLKIKEMIKLNQELYSSIKNGSSIKDEDHHQMSAAKKTNIEKRNIKKEELKNFEAKRFIKRNKIIQEDKKACQSSKIFQLALRKDYHDLEKQLKIQKISISNCKDINDHTLVHIACLNNDIELLKLLIQLGATKNDFLAVDKMDLTPIMYILYHFNQNNDSSVLTYLLCEIFDLDEKLINDRTLLHYAAYNGNYELAKLLISMCANVNIEYFGDTPLHYATKMHHDKIVYLLLTNDAQSKPNNKGETPEMLAKYYASSSISKLLNRAKSLSPTKRQSDDYFRPIRNSLNNKVFMDTIGGLPELNLTKRANSELLNQRRLDVLQRRNPFFLDECMPLNHNFSNENSLQRSQSFAGRNSDFKLKKGDQQSKDDTQKDMSKRHSWRI